MGFFDKLKPQFYRFVTLYPAFLPLSSAFSAAAARERDLTACKKHRTINVKTGCGEPGDTLFIHRREAYES